MEAKKNFFKKNLFVILVLVVALIFPKVITNTFYLSLLIAAGIWSISAMGLVSIMRTGQFSMGQAAFMAIGAYSALLLMLSLHINFWVGLLVAGLVAGLAAALIGAAVLRLGGVYFSIVTLALGEVVRVVTTGWTSLTKGANGLVPPPPPDLHVFGATISFMMSKVPFYYLIVVVICISGVVFWRLDNSRFGRIFRCMANSELLSAHLGISLMKYRVISFTVAGFFARVAGAIFAQYLFFMGPSVMGTWESIMLVMMIVIGGVGSPVAGPILGALVISALGDYITTILVGLKPLVFGVMLVVIMYFLPNGLVSLPGLLFKKKRAAASIPQPTARKESASA
ncbi:MAG: branched-chain amino acid ABC transporter permease [Bacillota bacterium]